MARGALVSNEKEKRRMMVRMLLMVQGETRCWVLQDPLGIEKFGNRHIRHWKSDLSWSMF